MQSNKIVAYYYDEEVGNYNDVNLMRPHRVRLAHNLIDGYGLQEKMLVHQPSRSLNTAMREFHADGSSPRVPHSSSLIALLGALVNLGLQ